MGIATLDKKEAIEIKKHVMVLQGRKNRVMDAITNPGFLIKIAEVYEEEMDKVKQAARIIIKIIDRQRNLLDRINWELLKYPKQAKIALAREEKICTEIQEAKRAEVITQKIELLDKEIKNTASLIEP
ncbi:hypothetical protein JW851_03560 [Candidatus Woesearchaeota archaeon]|nr:hypothetical protein [Candidatus Woesearchaeota archaeon]